MNSEKLAINTLLNSQRNTQSGIHFFHFGIGERADKVGQQMFWDTSKVVTIDCAIMFEPFVSAYIDLSGKVFVFSVYRSANNRVELSIN